MTDGSGLYDRDGRRIENDGMENSIGSNHEILVAQANAQRASFCEGGPGYEVYAAMYEPWNLPVGHGCTPEVAHYLRTGGFMDRGRTRD